MNEEEKYILASIKGWVWSGFYSESDIREMLYDILEDGCVEDMLLASIAPECAQKLLAEKEWPEITDFDRLHNVFYKLHEEGICALHDAGFKVEWDGTITTRICLPAIDWKKRTAKQGPPQTS